MVMHVIVFNKEVYVRSINISMSFMTNARPSVEADAVASMPQEEIDAAVRTAGAKRKPHLPRRCLSIHALQMSPSYYVPSRSTDRYTPFPVSYAFGRDTPSGPNSEAGTPPS